MDEVAQCFTDGLNGTETWLKKNLSRYHEENAPPQLRGNPVMLNGMVAMKTGQMINMIKQFYGKGKEE